MPRFKGLAAAVMFASFLSSSTELAGQPKSSWPAVQTLDASFAITDSSKAVVKTFIRDRTGRATYLFICRTGDDETVANVNYSGDLDCRLIPAERGEVEENLLLEAPKLAAWYSRGRMFARELQGDCARYPEYGLVRNFRLRGMRLTMTFDDVVFASPVQTRTARRGWRHAHFAFVSSQMRAPVGPLRSFLATWIRHEWFRLIPDRVPSFAEARNGS